MALLNYNETDTAATFNIGCSGQSAGTTTDGRQCSSGALGSGSSTVDPGNASTSACFVFETTAPNRPTWQAGDYVVRINHTSISGSTQLVRIDICDRNGASYATVVGNHVPSHTRGATGVVTATINRGTDYTPQSQANSTVFIVLTYNNNAPHGNSAATITMDQVINTPIDDGVVAEAATWPGRALLGVGR